VPKLNREDDDMKLKKTVVALSALIVLLVAGCGRSVEQVNYAIEKCKDFGGLEAMHVFPNDFHCNDGTTIGGN
jgi:hypothetical protein